jgi:hypothetical protein
VFRMQAINPLHDPVIVIVPPPPSGIYSAAIALPDQGESLPCLARERQALFSMDYKDISERITLLTQEIRDLQRMDAALNCDSRISRASRRKERELRLSQIREELSKMMLKPSREQ